MSRWPLRVLAPLLLTAAVAAQQPDTMRPRFRAGTNLVTVDAYVSKDGTPVTDLRADEVEILEDGRPQKVEDFRLVHTRKPVTSTTTSSDPSVSRAALTDPGARVFGIFIDTWHISGEGSHQGADPVAGLLNDVIGADDLVGWTTPDLSARSMPLTRRTAGIQRVLETYRNWNERDRVDGDPREGEFMGCYPDDPVRYPEFAGIAKELIERRRERKTLLALDELVTHLGTLRDDRKFVLLLTEGWVRFRPSNRLTGQLASVRGGELVRAPVPKQAPVRVGPDGRITTQPEPGNVDFDSCERERVILGGLDHSRTLEELAQRANRENVSFYIVDPRGATPFDDTVGHLRPAVPPADRVRLASRQGGLRELAEQTDGVALLNASYTREGVARMMADLRSYYLMSYYSTNAKMDGKFRKLSVRVTRPGVEVRARPGYLAPTEAEVLGATTAAPAGPAGGVTSALAALAPARGNLPLRLQAAGGRGRVRAVIELDPATAKQPEWAGGGTAKVSIEPEASDDGTKAAVRQTVSVEFTGSQRSISVDELEASLPPGRYIVRAELMPRTSRQALNVSALTTVPDEGALVGVDVLASRRGPSTGLAFVPTADQRFRRTERLRVELPLMVEGVSGVGRVLTREGQPLPLVVTYSATATAGVAEVILAPLSTGEYVLELTLTKDAASATVVYGFRLVP
jgi:VWFA-related protein